MQSFLKNYIKGKPITDTEIEDYLYDICDEVHSSCHSGCPVYAAHNCVPNTSHSRYGCDVFKSGKGMLEFLRKEES